MCMLFLQPVYIKAALLGQMWPPFFIAVCCTLLLLFFQTSIREVLYLWINADIKHHSLIMHTLNEKSDIQGQFSHV